MVTGNFVRGKADRSPQSTLLYLRTFHMQSWCVREHPYGQQMRMRRNHLISKVSWSNLW